ncbi:MAG TPA: hypothetical protein VFO91_03595 [Anaerolineales bacterium]|nr:hypothetical protein [Anaerolineales bacterium]
MRSVVVFVIVSILLSACSAGESAATATSIPTETPIVPPTLTPTANVPLAVLLIPADLDPETSNLYQKTVYDLAQESGFHFQVLNSLSPEEIEPGLRIVVAFPPDPGIAALAAAAPEVQFLAINIPEVSPGGNISVLSGGGQSDVAAFLAGYTAALTTEDYRIGMILPKDNPDAIRALNAYANGMKFYCGICRPLYFSQWAYPQYIEIPAEEDRANYDAYADVLILQYRVTTIYLYPDIAIPELYTYIGTTGTSMIGAVSPEERPAGWMMTIQPDIIQAIQNAWPDLVSGNGGITVQSPLGLSDVDPSLLSPGKQRLVEEKLRELQGGLISTGAGP